MPHCTYQPRWIAGWIDKRINGWKEGGKDGWVDRSINGGPIDNIVMDK